MEGRVGRLEAALQGMASLQDTLGTLRAVRVKTTRPQGFLAYMKQRAPTTLQ